MQGLRVINSGWEKGSKPNETLFNPTQGGGTYVGCLISNTGATDLVIKLGVNGIWRDYMRVKKDQLVQFPTNEDVHLSQQDANLDAFWVTFVW